MKIDRVIARLNALLEQYGNVDVKYYVGADELEMVDYVEYEEIGDSGVVTLE